MYEGGRTRISIVDVLKADNVPSSKRVLGVLALKKFWIACRDRYELDRLPDRELCFGRRKYLSKRRR